MYRRIIEAVPEGIWVVDPQGRTIFSNRRMAEMLGTDFASMSEQSCFGWVFPEELDDAQRQFARNVAGDTRPFDFRLRRADGSPIWVSISAMPVYDDAGTTVGLLGLFADITDRRQADAALRRSEERFRFAQRAGRIGTFDWDIKTGVNTWTPELEAMYGLTPGSFPGTQAAWEALLHPDDREKVLQRVAESFESGTSLEGDWRVVWPDRSIHWITGRYSRMRRAHLCA